MLTKIKKESGQIFVFTVALIFFIALFVCVFLNSAVLSLYKMKLQTTADACALTGAAYQAKLLDIIGDINDLIALLYAGAQDTAAIPFMWYDPTGYEAYEGFGAPFVSFEFLFDNLDTLKNIQEKIADWGNIGTPLIMQNIAEKNMHGSIAIPINISSGENFKKLMEKGERRRNDVPFWFMWTLVTPFGEFPIPLPLWPAMFPESDVDSYSSEIREAQNECQNWHWGSPPDYLNYLKDEDGDGSYSDSEKGEALKNCVEDKVGNITGSIPIPFTAEFFLTKDRDYITYAAVAVVGPSIGYEKFFMGRLFNFTKLEHPDMGSLNLSDIGSLQSIIEGVSSGGWFAVAAAKPYDGWVWKPDETTAWPVIHAAASDYYSKPYKVWLVKIKDERLKPEIRLPNKEKYLH